MDINIETIHRAVNGERDAQLIILQHYDSYINKLATVTRVDQYGKIYSYVDDDQKSEFQCILLEALKNFRGIKQES